MNYYDEEITINGPDTRNLNHFKMDRIPSTSIGSISSQRLTAASSSRAPTLRQRNVLRGSSTDDDGLLQDIIDHDDEDDDDDDDDDDDESEMQHAQLTNEGAGGTENLRPQTRPGSIRSAAKSLSAAKPPAHAGPLIVPSESESDEAVSPQPHLDAVHETSDATHASAPEMQLSIKPEQWEKLNVHQELKDLFPYILKYTPQCIDTPYRLQPFIPDFVPSVGDVDAFLKVTTPPLLKPQRQQEISEFLYKMGLYLLDEPSGDQSEPSLLNMKLRSVLSGSVAKARTTSASMIPTARSAKEIDKWISEVEKLHMTQMVNDVQPRKEIEPLLLNWPRSYADTSEAVQQAYQLCLKDGDVAHYVRTLCQLFEVEGPAETQVDYILNVQTLFALYLAANQAWE